MNRYPPIIEFFEIKYLNGYKNIRLNLETNAKIISAENGSGKTTVLNTLYYILTNKISNLLTLDFSVITLKFLNSKLPIIIDKSKIFPQIDAFIKTASADPSFQRAIRHGLTESEIFELVFCHLSSDEPLENSIGYKKLYANSPYDDDDIKNISHRLSRHMTGSKSYSDVTTQIQKCLEGISIL